MEKILFKENQRPKQTWIFILCFVILLLFLWGFVQQVILDKPFGNHPVSNLEFSLLGLVPAILLILVFTLRLKTEIRNDGIYYKFNWFNRSFRKISFDDVEKYEVRTYSPLIEYGGWGIRYKLSKGKGFAYNISGNKGAEFFLKNGKTILIGTQKPKEMELALSKMIND